MQKEFKTVMQQESAEIVEKRSRFIASVKPVENEQEAIEFVNSLKSHYWDATHNVYAYLINNEVVSQKFSDDGEPSGTAGMPVLEAIKRSQVQNIVVVVTRYFGGTLLGAAGLVRAYGKSASTGIEAAKVIIKRLCNRITITIEYGLLGKVQNTIISSGGIISNIDYGENVTFHVLVEVDMAEKFVLCITEVTSALASIAVGEKEYIVLDDEGKLLVKNEHNI